VIWQNKFLAFYLCAGKEQVEFWELFESSLEEPWKWRAKFREKNIVK
jgi:hypothetical protein